MLVMLRDFVSQTVITFYWLVVNYPALLNFPRDGIWQECLAKAASNKMLTAYTLCRLNNYSPVSVIRPITSLYAFRIPDGTSASRP